MAVSWLRTTRSQAHEWLDAADVPMQALRGNLTDLRRLNCCLGSRWLVLNSLRRLWQRAGQPSTWHLLDIGTGAADLPIAMRHWGRRHGIQLRITAIDHHPRVIRYARTELQTLPDIALIQADGLRLPFTHHTFDVAVCSTMLHHLSDDQAVKLLQGMKDVVRYGLMVNDLRRSRLHYYGAKCLMPLLSRNHLTRHDGPLSVSRAYSLGEIRQLTAAAGLNGACVRPALSYRWLLEYTCPPH